MVRTSRETRRAGGPVLALAAALALAAGSPAASGADGVLTAPTGPGAAATPRPGTAPGAEGGATPAKADEARRSLSTAERAFIVNAAAASMTEIRAGRLAADKAADASVKAYGQMLVEQHGRSGEELVRFAKGHEVALPDALPAARRQMMRRLDQASGSEFDRLFIEQVGRRLHEEAIRMFESALVDSQNAELKAWIETTLPHLREHLSQAQKLPSGGARGSRGAKTG